MSSNSGEPHYDSCNPVTPTQQQHNAGAGHYNSDTENSECQFDSDEPGSKKKRRQDDKQNSEISFVGYAAHDCAEFYPSDFTTIDF